MEQLRVIGTEDGALVLATESGERFVLAVDEVLRAELRRMRHDREAEQRGTRPSPREIQAHIRAGLSAEEVADLLGARVEDVARYERPVLAEREHIVDQALAVPVLLAGDFDQDTPPTFGTAVRSKLTEARATGERWTSWKEPAGWVVKVEFLAGEVDRDARWSFDPRRGTLAPLNADATQLSRQGPIPEGLIPRLRALESPEPIDQSRFDSGAFGPRAMIQARQAQADATPVAPVAAVAASVSPVAVQDAAIKRAPEPDLTSSETADLLEALRRRRGQREPSPGFEPDSSSTASPVALFDALEPGYDEEPREEEPPAEMPQQASVAGENPRRRGRTSMPSWDEIVFGARTEE